MRVVGTRTNALFLRELRGTPFLELWREEDRDEMRAILANVADEAQPFLIGAAARPLGFAPIDVEILLLPLRHHGDTHSRILGCCAPNASPHWLGLIGVESMALLTLRALDPRERADAPPPGPAGSQGFGRAPSLPRRGHLFHYSSNR